MMSRQNNTYFSHKIRKQSLRASVYVLLGIGLSGCTTLSMSDFGIGSSEPKTTTTQQAPQQITNVQRTTTHQAKDKEPGMWDRVTGWFSTDKKTEKAVKGNNLSVAKAQTTTQAPTTSDATNASLRAAQDASALNVPLPNNPAPAPQNVQAQTGPVQLAQANTAQQVSTTRVTTPQAQLNAPQKLSASGPLPTKSNLTQSNVKSATTRTVTNVQQPQTFTKPPQQKGFLDRIGSWFSPSKKAPTQTAQVNKPTSSVNGLASVSPTAPKNTSSAKALTPTQTLRLSRQKSTSAQVSSQGLTPYVPNAPAPTKVADAATKTNAIQPQKKVITKAPRISTPKVAVKQLAPTNKPATRTNTVQRTASITRKPVTEKTSYVVTPETYRAARNAPSRPTQSAQTAKSTRLASAAPSASAYKFYFNPGSSNLAPHHIAQLKGLASQAIARQRDVVVLGTSNPGGEAGAGASKLALQNIATARAMAAAKNLQRFGVPTHKIKMRIAQSTTPSEIGTGGNRTLASMSARRVEVSIQ